MKNLHFDYYMEIKYSSNVENCHYTIKCLPQDSARQKISDIEITMIPESKPEYATDSLGNRYIFGCNKLPHDVFQFRITGSAACGLSDYEEAVDENELMIYRHHNGLNTPQEGLKSYYKTIKAELELDKEASALNKAVKLMNRLHEDFSYMQGVTNVDTTAEEAFLKGQGVCQDYSHILISLLILAGCSARYVTGLLIGEGASHAWVEVADGNKWYALDPTNNILVKDNHIKIGVGRHAKDCTINRGIMHGGGDQTQTISVSVSDTGFGDKHFRKGAVL